MCQFCVVGPVELAHEAPVCGRQAVHYIDQGQDGSRGHFLFVPGVIVHDAFLPRSFAIPGSDRLQRFIHPHPHVGNDIFG